MEYDCFAKPSGVEEYCVHIMSRTPTMDPTKLQAMLDYAGVYFLFPIIESYSTKES